MRPMMRVYTTWELMMSYDVGFEMRVDCMTYTRVSLC